MSAVSIEAMPRDGLNELLLSLDEQGAEYHLSTAAQSKDSIVFDLVVTSEHTAPFAHIALNSDGTWAAYTTEID